MNLKEKTKMLPSAPGVYLMKDSTGSIIYVGKSKSLKNRVQSYFQNSKNHSRKVEKLVKHLKDFDYILTDTEFEAFMLECKLIKELQPIYNKLMKSPQSYTYIRIRIGNVLNSIEMTNHTDENDGNLYFGPYSSKNTVEKAIKGIKEFLKMDCTNPSNKNTPCLNYSLGLCTGICFDRSAIEQYSHNINRIIALLEGTDTSILKEMEQEMKEASINFEFEKAARLRDSLGAIKTILRKEKVIEFTKENKNIAVIEFIDKNVLKMFLISSNMVIYNAKYEIDYTNIKQMCQWIKESILSNFIIKDTSSNTDIGKEEIDEAQIIYSYLNSTACDYVIIPEKWLYTENHNKIDKVICGLLNGELNKR